MQLLRHLTSLLLCAAGISAIPSGYAPSSQVEERETTLLERTDPTIGTELQFWNQQPGVPTGGLGLGLYLFQGTLPREKSKDSTYSKLIVEGMDAAKANHHYLIGVLVADTPSGPPKKQVITRDATVTAWDIAVSGADTMVLSKSATQWKRAQSPLVTYTYLKKAKSDKPSDISTKGS